MNTEQRLVGMGHAEFATRSLGDDEARKVLETFAALIADPASPHTDSRTLVERMMARRARMLRRVA